jgi:hypothetical protein
LPPLALLLQVDEEPNECDVEGMGKRRLYGDVHSSDSHILSQKHAATGVYKDSKRCVLSVGQQVGEVLLKRPLPSPGRYGFVFFLDKFVDLDNFSWLMMYAASPHMYVASLEPTRMAAAACGWVCLHYCRPLEEQTIDESWTVVGAASSVHHETQSVCRLPQNVDGRLELEVAYFNLLLDAFKEAAVGGIHAEVVWRSDSQICVQVVWWQYSSPHSQLGSYALRFRLT